VPRCLANRKTVVVSWRVCVHVHRVCVHMHAVNRRLAHQINDESVNNRKGTDTK